jgi:hypothetical protein
LKEKVRLEDKVASTGAESRVMIYGEKRGLSEHKKSDQRHFFGRVPQRSKLSLYLKEALPPKPQPIFAYFFKKVRGVNLLMRSTIVNQLEHFLYIYLNLTKLYFEDILIECKNIVVSNTISN